MVQFEQFHHFPIANAHKPGIWAKLSLFNCAQFMIAGEVAKHTI